MYDVRLTSIFIIAALVCSQNELGRVNGACCSQDNHACAGWVHDPSFVCSVGCAAVILPFMEKCHGAIDNIFDTFATDTTVDGKVSVYGFNYFQIIFKVDLCLHSYFTFIFAVVYVGPQ